MSRHSVQEYAASTRRRYRSGNREAKRRILDEFCAATRMHRKAAIRLLNQDEGPRLGKSKGGRPQKDSPEVVAALAQVWEAGDREDDRWRLPQAITSFLRNASTVQPLAIVLEDLHWADRGTLDLLLHVARNLQGARLLIIGTYRDVEVDRAHPLSGTLAELRRQGNFLRVPLRGLTVDEVHRMYESIRGQSVDWAQAELVHRQTEGHPLFVQEVLRYLVEEGIVYRQDGRYQVRPGDAASEAVIPEGLRDVVGRRLSRLSVRANEVLSTASVIGRDFRLDVLQRVLAWDEDNLFVALEDARERAIIEERQAPGAVGFRFTHAFFRQTLYEEIFAPRRIRWHQQVGRALEDVYQRRLEEHAVELAEHFAQSTETADLEKAVRYSELAAQRAMAVYAYSEAVGVLEQALKAQEILDPDNQSRLCDLTLALAEASGPAGQASNQLSAAEAAFNLAVTLSDAVRASRACRIAYVGLQRQGPGSFISPVGELWAKRADSYAAPGSLDRVYADLFLARVAVEGIPLVRSALALARELDNLEAMARCVILLLAADELDVRLRLAREFSSKPKQGLSAWSMCALLSFSGSLFLAEGDRKAAEGCLEQLRELAERTREPFSYIHLALISAYLAFSTDG